MDIYEKEKKIKVIKYESAIWLIFIFNSLITILGNNYSLKSIINESSKLEKKARNLFLVASYFSFMTYCYFFKRNYKNYINSVTEEDDESSLLHIRSLGSLLLIVGSILIIYFQINQKGFISTPETGL